MLLLLLSLSRPATSEALSGTKTCGQGARSAGNQREHLLLSCACAKEKRAY